MKLTLIRLAGRRDLTVRRWNRVWLEQGQFYDKPVQIPPALLKKGVEIVDMKEYLKPKHKLWKPPVPDDPRWVEPVPLEERPDWKEQTACSFDQNVQIYEGVKQACLVAKAQHFEGLPPGVERLLGAVDIPNRDLLLQRFIMLSQKWNTDDDKLPKRRPHPENPIWSYPREFGVLPEKASLILMKNLLRLCQTQRAEFPSLASRKHVAEPLLDSHVIYRDQPIVQREELEFLLTSDTWLPPFGDADLVDASVAHKLPDMWPVLPTVDFKPTNNYELNSFPGFKGEHKFWCPHTIVQTSKQQRLRDWSDSQYQASQILTSLLLTSAVARHRFGAEIETLPEPICVQHVLVEETRLFLSYFQLNTLDLSQDSGLKNLVWTAPPCQLYQRTLSKPWIKEEPYLHTKMEEFDGDAFEPLLASYLYGLPEVAGR